MAHLKANEIAKDLGIAKITAIKYIQQGFLPAQIVYNKNQPYYVVDQGQYQEWKNKHFKGLKRGQISKHNRSDKDLTLSKIAELKEDWIDWCLKGKLNGKPIAPRTAEIYSYYFDMYLDKLGKYPSKPLVSIAHLREVLGSISVSSFSTRINVYSAVMSFSRYLIENNLLDGDFIDKLKTLRPKRFLPAKKTSVNEAELEKLIQTIRTTITSDFDKLTSETIVIFLANTGLRASELCNLQISDIDLETKRVYVRLGKGNKNRTVGLNNETYKQLLKYLKARLSRETEIENFFINKLGNAFNNESLSKKIKRIAAKAGLDVSPHSLRRGFVTMNVNKGKQIVHLQIACGHSNISTTRGYCMTTQDEVVEAMKHW